VRERWAGPILVVLILGGVVAVLVLNINTGPSTTGSVPSPSAPTQVAPPTQIVPQSVSPVLQPAGFREYPIGDEFQKNEMTIRAVWLPPIQMEGMEMPASTNTIHLEADIHATEGNRNGFAKDEFIPYLVVRYTIVPVNDKNPGQRLAPNHGKAMPMAPMVARDGLHYGATVEMPGDGHYKLTYAIEPPSVGGLGRHVDAATGVAPWWKPFEVSFDWDFRRATEAP
jgi:uncharacterized protein involved in high-affinity Fe2+ transport